MYRGRDAFLLDDPPRAVGLAAGDAIGFLALAGDPDRAGVFAAGLPCRTAALADYTYLSGRWTAGIGRILPDNGFLP